MEALELSERTVPGKGGKAGPQGQYESKKSNEYRISQKRLCILIEYL